MASWCLMLAVLSAPSARAQDADTADRPFIGTWLYREKTDPMTDAKSWGLLQEATDSHGAMVFTCDDQAPRLSLAFDFGRHFSAPDGLRTVMLRFDQKPAQKEQMRHSDGTFWLGIRAAIPSHIMAALTSASMVRFRAYDGDGRTFDLEFETKDTAKAIEKIAEHCKI